MSKEDKTRSRRERAAMIQQSQQRAERRRSLLLIGPAVLIAVALVGSAVYVVLQQQRETAAAEEAAERPIEEVETYEDLSRNHVETAVDYPQTPGVGGDHAPVWTNCGIYTDPVDEAQSVHSLEHGAVWLTYSPDLPEEDVAALEDLAPSGSYVLLSPDEDQESPVVATAWGVQLALDSATDERIRTFVTKYEQGEQTPEPGAACTGGVGGPA